jgi:hypothetical protein
MDLGSPATKPEDGRVVLHPAYATIARAERCWTADDAQARIRANLLVRLLFDHGLLVNAAVDGDFVVTPQRGAP